MSAGNGNPFSPSTSRKEPATPPNPNPKIKQRRTNFTSEMGTTIYNSPSLVDRRLRHCRTDRNSDRAKKTQFPTDVILLRLGVKSLLRFRCGIEDTNFAIGTLEDNVDGIRFRLLATNHLQVLPSEKILGFLGHCNGLVSAHLYSNETNSSSIIFWNPLSMEHRRCPMPQRCLTDIQLFAFGYNSISNDYKLVTATTLSFAKKQEWKHLNGCIYWLISREGRSNCGIVSFDLSTDRLREEESASWVLSTNESKAFIGLDLLGESLCLMVTDDEVIYDVWMMEENVVNSTKPWIKLFSVSSIDGNFNTALDDPLNGDAITPVCFIGNRKLLIFWHSRHEYVLYDPGDQSVKKVAEIGNPFLDLWPVSPYVESIVSLGRRIQSLNSKFINVII
ncbi:hypothetical protein SLEP1_g53212 [Rubroshorea leprosula]|uniref:F-box associated beta-propeller type 1 domain-containing protein n=1 Tax=Rubroshorea leprosula TaxID=152421 RepID=A0AAV5MCN3_9ROSI|nr:hypothetical protein SLEP1_g53212 [Rubroshorea leprosula]